MLGFPLLIVWVILAAVLGIVGGAAVWTWRKDGDLGVSPLLLLGVTLYATSLLGYFVTEWGPMTPAEWRKPFVVRVLWQLGAGAVLAVAVVVQSSPRRRDPKVYLLGLAFFVISVMMANPALADLLDGPVSLTGLASVHIDKSRGPRSTISGSMKLTAPDGTDTVVETAGLGANQMESMFATCKENMPVRVLWLGHTGKVLDASCATR